MNRSQLTSVFKPSRPPNHLPSSATIASSTGCSPVSSSSLKNNVCKEVWRLVPNPIERLKTKSTRTVSTLPISPVGPSFRFQIALVLAEYIKGKVMPWIFSKFCHFTQGFAWFAVPHERRSHQEDASGFENRAWAEGWGKQCHHCSKAVRMLRETTCLMSTQWAVRVQIWIAEIMASTSQGAIKVHSILIQYHLTSSQTCHSLVQTCWFDCFPEALL